MIRTCISCVPEERAFKVWDQAQVATGVILVISILATGVLALLHHYMGVTLLAMTVPGGVGLWMMLESAILLSRPTATENESIAKPLNRSRSATPEISGTEKEESDEEEVGDHGSPELNSPPQRPNSPASAANQVPSQPSTQTKSKPIPLEPWVEVQKTFASEMLEFLNGATEADLCTVKIRSKFESLSIKEISQLFPNYSQLDFTLHQEFYAVFQFQAVLTTQEIQTICAGCITGLYDRLDRIFKKQQEIIEKTTFLDPQALLNLFPYRERGDLTRQDAFGVSSMTKNEQGNLNELLDEILYQQMINVLFDQGQLPFILAQLDQKSYGKISSFLNISHSIEFLQMFVGNKNSPSFLNMTENSIVSQIYHDMLRLYIRQQWQDKCFISELQSFVIDRFPQKTFRLVIQTLDECLVALPVNREKLFAAYEACQGIRQILKSPEFFSSHETHNGPLAALFHSKAKGTSAECKVEWKESVAAIVAEKSIDLSVFARALTTAFSQGFPNGGAFFAIGEKFGPQVFSLEGRQRLLVMLLDKLDQEFETAIETNKGREIVDFQRLYTEFFSGTQWGVGLLHNPF